MVAERIKAYIEERGIKQCAVAKAAGMTDDAISRVLKGQRKLTADEFIKICRFLRVPADTFTD